MLLGEKITRLRKKLGLTQEDLADRLGVSRQAVSKWESGQSTPDLERVVAMSGLFGVSTDYLLKDEEEPPIKEPASSAGTQDPAPEAPPQRRVSMEQAEHFLALRKKASVRIALGVMLCILSPVALILLAGWSEYAGPLTLPEHTAAALGLGALFLLVAVAVTLFIHTGFQSRDFGFLETEDFRLADGVMTMVRQRQSAFRPALTWSVILGVGLCILSPLPLILVGLLTDQSAGQDLMQQLQQDWLMVWMVILLLVLVAVGVGLLVWSGVHWSATEKLLSEGDYRPEKKKLESTIGSIYWPLVTALYLAVSFLGGCWNISWVIWPLAGVVYGAIEGIATFLENRKN